MIKRYFKPLNLVAILFVMILFCFVCLAGCQQSNSEKNMDSDTIVGLKDFQTQSDQPPTSKTLFAMADILAAQGKDKECEFVLRRILTEYPKFLPAYNSLAELQMRQGQINDAIETINNAFRIDPDDTLLQNNLGVCFIVTGEYEKAFTMFTKSACSNPENARYRMNMAVALGLMGRDEESLSLFRQVLPEKQAQHNLTILKDTTNHSNYTSASNISNMINK